MEISAKHTPTKEEQKIIDRLFELIRRNYFEMDKFTKLINDNGNNKDNDSNDCYKNTKDYQSL